MNLQSLTKTSDFEIQQKSEQDELLDKNMGLVTSGIKAGDVKFFPYIENSEFFKRNSNCKSPF